MYLFSKDCASVSKINPMHHVFYINILLLYVRDIERNNIMGNKDSLHTLFHQIYRFAHSLFQYAAIVCTIVSIPL
jgi:hypothetical protein